ncbi:MAG TPA: hypothetical protein DCY20_04175 [Firmicutes bacterium]|nr:hypothetical protein [Bacillota bacterium]
MKNKSWVTRCLMLWLLIQIFRGVLNVADVLSYVLSSEGASSSALVATRIAVNTQAISVGIFALPVVYALVRSKPYTGNIFDWYCIVFVWCSAIRQVVEHVYDTTSMSTILLTFIFNVSVCLFMIKSFQYKHPQMYCLHE